MLTGKLPKLSAVILAVSCFALPSAHAALVDDFNTTTLSAAYTQTVVLDQDTVRNVTFSSPSGVLRAVATATSKPEQVLLLRSDISLTPGNILRADVNWALAGVSQDLGIALSSTATPVIRTDTTNLSAGNDRKNYIFSGVRADATHYLSSGFGGAAGTTSLGTNQVFGLNLTGLFIRRNTDTNFDVGYNTNNGPDVIAFTYNLTTTNVGDAIGFYGDLRAGGTVSGLDNLRITAIPEPTSLSLLALPALSVLRRRRKA